MGVVVPDGPDGWIGAPPATTAAGQVAVSASRARSRTRFSRWAAGSASAASSRRGGEAVTDAADYLAFFAGDEGTRAVGLFLETVRRPAAFADGARALRAAGKPVALPQGRPVRRRGSCGALAHGALVGSVRAFAALLRRHGAIEVDDFHELVGDPRDPRAPAVVRVVRGLGAICESGGECAVLADQAEAAGMPFEPLPETLAARLQERFPNYLAPGNPLDAWAIAPEEEVYPARWS